MIIASDHLWKHHYTLLPSEKRLANMLGSRRANEAGEEITRHFYCSLSAETRVVLKTPSVGTFDKLSCRNSV